MRNNIGLNYIMDQLQIFTPYGRECLRNLKPYPIEKLPQLKLTLDNLEVMMGSISAFSKIHDDIEREFCRIKDIKGSIERCKKQGILDDIELFEIKLFAIYGEKIKESYKTLKITMEGVNFGELGAVIDLLDPLKHRSATFSIYDAYSEELREVRDQKRSIEKLLYQANDREQGEALRCERLKLVEEEVRIEGEIRQQLSHRLVPHLELLEETMTSIGILDLCIAKAKLAKKMACTKPQFQDFFQLELVGGRHPYIEELLTKEKKTFTKINIKLVAGSNAITGPNMGGKSVAIKTIALNGLLAHMGFFVFADILRLSAFDFVHLLSSDHESLKNGLSTFGGEIVKFNEYMEDIKCSRGLVLIDEFASGTNPHEGRLLVKSLMEYLNGFDTISVLITHFDGVVGDNINHYQVVGLRHVNFNTLINGGNYDPNYGLKMIQQLMDYRLEPVENRRIIPRDALNISMLLGLDSEILQIAKGHYHKEVQFCGKETEKNA